MSASATARQEFGDCIMSTHVDPRTGEYTFTIDHADPRILISCQMLREIFTGPAPGSRARVTLADPIPAEDWYLGAVLRIEDANRTVVYRITSRYGEYAYVGEWPD